MLGRGVFIFEGIDIDNISGLELVRDRLNLSVDNCIFESQTDRGMNTKCEIQNRRSDRQFLDISSRSINEDGLVKDFDIELRFEFFLLLCIDIVRNDLLEPLYP